MIRKSLLLGIAAMMALGVFALGGDGASADLGAGSMTAMSLDMDPAGNTATSVGTIQDCVEVDAGASVAINLVAQGIPASYQMIAFVATVGMPAATLSVTNVDSTVGLLDSAAGSSAIEASETPPDSNGAPETFNISGADTGVIPGSSESGDGILSILVIEVNATALDGIYNLSLFDSAHFDTTSTAWEPSVNNGARIAVGALTCLNTFKQGDVDCNNTVNSVDALKVLRFGAGLSVTQTEPCANIGTGSPLNGNVDCSPSGVNSVDALKILRFGAGLSVSQTEPPPCLDIGVNGP